jgi:hypothetical protein
MTKLHRHLGKPGQKEGDHAAAQQVLPIICLLSWSGCDMYLVAVQRLAVSELMITGHFGQTNDSHVAGSRRVIRQMTTTKSAYDSLVRAKPTASGRATQRASSDPACTFWNTRLGLFPAGGGRESALPSYRELLGPIGPDGLGVDKTHAPNRGYLT